MKSRCLLTQVHRGPVWGDTGDCVTIALLEELQSAGGGDQPGL